MLILYLNAAKFSIKLFYFIYFTDSFVSQRDKYEIVTETHPFKNPPSKKLDLLWTFSNYYTQIRQKLLDRNLLQHCTVTLLKI